MDDKEFFAEKLRLLKSAIDYECLSIIEERLRDSLAHATTAEEVGESFCQALRLCAYYGVRLFDEYTDMCIQRLHELEIAVPENLRNVMRAADQLAS